MRRRVFVFWTLFVAIALARLVFSFSDTPPDIGKCLKVDTIGRGVVAGEPSRTESGQIMVIDVGELSVGGESPVGGSDCPDNILVRAKTKLYPRFSYGDRIKFSGKLIEPFNFKSDNGRSFDYRGYLAKDDIYFEMRSAVVRLITDDEISGARRTGEGFAGEISGSVRSALFRLKRRFVGNLERALGEPHAALAAGLVVGEKSALGKDLIDDFRTVGLIHIVVLSGFNITIVADALRRLLSFLPRIWGITVGGIGITLFGILVGGGATVVRSCFMAGVALAAQLIRRDYQVMRALVFAGLIMLIENPMILLHDPSFQLSFLATLGLILLSKPIEDRATFITESIGLRGIVASTFATQIFVSPLILYMMGQVSIIGVVANILVLPLVPATMLAVFLTGALGFVSPLLSDILGWLTHLLLTYELSIVEYFADIPFATVSIPPFQIWWVMGFYTVFIAVVFFRKVFLEKRSLSRRMLV